MRAHNNRHSAVFLAKFLGLILSICIFQSSAAAAVVGSFGRISSLRIEGTVAFIGVSSAFAGSTQCDSRVWLDMSNPIGRAVYATALTAFQNKQEIWIRAHEEGARVFGACILYDIYIAQVN